MAKRLAKRTISPKRFRKKKKEKVMKQIVFYRNVSMIVLLFFIQTKGNSPSSLSWGVEESEGIKKKPGSHVSGSNSIARKANPFMIRWFILMVK